MVEQAARWDYYARPHSVVMGMVAGIGCSVAAIGLYEVIAAGAYLLLRKTSTRDSTSG
jgi:hypothetical protein